MNVVVLIAGVHDPKWPLPPIGEGRELAPGEHQVMSPFDEAALEVALRLRDADAGVRITAYVGGGDAGLRTARAVAALNVADVSLVALDRPWDQLATARALAGLCEGADLVLIGREFGDFDDGLVPPLLAGALGTPFFGRAQTVGTGDGICLSREAQTSIETLRLSGPAVVSLTNDRRTRLRKPLMKNVMQARQAVIAKIDPAKVPTPGLVVASLAERVADRRAGDCALIAGEAAEQARAVAALLWEARA